MRSADPAPGKPTNPINKKPPGSFAIVPSRAAHANVTARAYKVLIAIARFADARGYAWPSMRTIAELTSINRTKVPGSIRELEAAGLLIKASRSKRGTNLYRLVFDVSVLREAASTVGLEAGLQDGPMDNVAIAGKVQFSNTASEGVPSDGNGELPFAATAGVANNGNQTDHDRTYHITDHRTDRDALDRKGYPLTDYKPTAEVVAWIHENCPWIPDATDPTLVAGFRDYYLARGRTFTNPDAAFRRWCVKAKDFGSPARSRRQSTLIEAALAEIEKG